MDVKKCECDFEPYSGNRNIGNKNSGDWNSGGVNSGNNNSGNNNSGDWNTGNGNSGCFMTTTPTVWMFNKPSDWTRDMWLHSVARDIMERCPHGTYLQDNEVRMCADDASQKWWDGLCAEDRAEILALPNFDAQIFRECTGINIKEGEE